MVKSPWNLCPISFHFQYLGPVGRGRRHLCHQQEPEVRHQIWHPDRFQKERQGRQARKTTEQAGRCNNQGAGQPPGGQLRGGQGALPSEKDKGSDQGDPGPMDILRYSYGQCTRDRPSNGGQRIGKSGLGKHSPKGRWERYARTSKKLPKNRGGTGYGHRSGKGT